MRRSTTRDLVGTLIVFVGLLAITMVFIFGEKFLENFKAH